MALCELGSSVNIMPKTMMERINHQILYPTQVQLQLVDSTIRNLEGGIRGLPIRIQGKFIRQDFTVLDDDTPLVLGRPFLYEAHARINMRNGTIHLCIWHKDMKFDFQLGDAKRIPSRER
jgi:hypothetical protein